MRAFECDECGNLLFFENTQCVECRSALGFLPDVLDLSALQEAKGNKQRARVPEANGRLYRLCANQVQHQVCNWLIPDTDSAELCESCRLNQTIPDLTVAGHRERWHRLELAKRRLLYTLRRLGLETSGQPEGKKPPLRFSFLADPPNGPRVLTGHANGLITMNVAEADDVYREQQRVHMHEPYRTLLGHFRHEVAHYYWDKLIAGSPHLSRFREVFGDETKEYATALQAYYANGPAPDWPLQFVTAYASAHPWEDWAETWAHYLHIQDTVETAASFGIRLQPRHPSAAAMTADPRKVKEDERSFDRILQEWLPVTYAVNELNRGMGLQDIYPFVLSERSMDKLGFIHEVVRTARNQKMG